MLCKNLTMANLAFRRSRLGISELHSPRLGLNTTELTLLTIINPLLPLTRWVDCVHECCLNDAKNLMRLGLITPNDDAEDEKLRSHRERYGTWTI